MAHVFRDRYFGITYPLPPDWIEKYKGPPPSDSGLYVLAQLSSPSGFKGSASGSILISAQDLFFTSAPAHNAVEFIEYMKDHLSSDYKVEMAPKQIAIAGSDFIFFAYWSPAAELYWYVLATQIRCHVVQFVLTSRDTKLLESLMVGMNRMKLPIKAGTRAGSGGDVPVCIKDYARDGNITARVDPVLAEHKFDPVPVRIIIGQNGKVRHIHFLSAFPDQSKAITEALSQWKFKPYAIHGQPMEVETGVLFGRNAP